MSYVPCALVTRKKVYIGKKKKSAQVCNAVLQAMCKATGAKAALTKVRTGQRVDGLHLVERLMREREKKKKHYTSQNEKAEGNEIQRKLLRRFL